MACLRAFHMSASPWCSGRSQRSPLEVVPTERLRDALRLPLLAGLGHLDLLECVLGRACGARLARVPHERLLLGAEAVAGGRRLEGVPVKRLRRARLLLSRGLGLLDLQPDGVLGRGTLLACVPHESLL